MHIAVKVRAVGFLSFLALLVLFFRSNYDFTDEIGKIDIKDKLYGFKAFKRKEAVKAAMQHAWKGYETFAFGKDELLPVTESYMQNWGGWGVTLIDSLDTLHIMGMHEELERAKKHVEQIDFNKTVSGHQTSVFETVIRSLGGLISAYELEQSPVFLEKAVELADILLPCFDTTTGIPYPTLDINEKRPYGYTTNLAEAGTLQLEFQKLSLLTGNKNYYEKSQKVIDLMDKAIKPIPGLYPRDIHIATGELSGVISIDAMADSFYEYLLKLYLMYGKNGEQYRRMYEESIDGIKEHMVFKSSGRLGLTFVSDLNAYTYTPNGHMGHLSCFFPGLLALGSRELNRHDDLGLAKDLMKTCYTMYSETKTGLGPEDVNFIFDDDENEIKPKVGNHTYLEDGPEQLKTQDYYIAGSHYVLRPETVESLMILYRVTGDEKYRDWGWNIFMSIEKYTKTPSGYSAYHDINDENKHLNWKNSMESFFLAETLKYLYLLFSPSNVISLDEYVFNTEAHPYKIVKDGVYKNNEAPA